MSTKLYNGYRIELDEDFDILDWQTKLFGLRDELTAMADQKHRHDFCVRAVYALDRDTMGLGRSYPDQSPLGAAYKAVQKDCEVIAKGQRRPTLDTEAIVCWQVLPDLRTILVIVYTEMRDYSDRVIEALGLEDYHYQNQVDPPDGCTWEEMVERGGVWGEAMGGWDNPPIARFNYFTLSESPKHPPLFLHTSDKEPPLYHKGIPMDERARGIAFDLLWVETQEDAKGKDTIAKLWYVEREAREGNSLHARLLELVEEVKTKLLAEPTWEDYRRKPGEEG